MALSLTVTNLSWKLMMITALFQASLTSVLSTSNDLSATITSNVTDGIVCYNKSIELNCHANDTVNVTTYKWISSTFKQPQETASITVMATDDPVQYTCTVTDANGNIGYSSINISSNATAPVLYRVNFNANKIVFVGDHVNLTVQVISNLTLIHIPTWSRKNANLPKGSRTANYSQDGNIFTSLIIHKASYADDGGIYYLNTSNYCDPSGTSVDLNIDKKDVECFPSGHRVPLLSSSNNQTTVEEEVITFRCIYQGNYSPSGYGSVYWIIALQNGSKIAILDYSNFPDYCIDTQRSCPYDNYACCRFTTELRIHTTLPLNNAMITCITIYDSVSSFNTSSLMVIERPILTRGPTDIIGITEYEGIHFECHFNSSLIKYLAICEWLKDEYPTSNGDKWQITEPGFENHLICGFNITSVSVDDEGNYSCYCYYNESFREQLHIPESDEIRSQSGKTVLQVEIQNQQSSGKLKEIFIAVCVPVSAVVAIIIVVILATAVAWCVQHYKRTPVTTTSGADNHNNSHDETGGGNRNEPHDPNHNCEEEIEDTSTADNSIPLLPTYSQPEGPSTVCQPSDSIIVLSNTDRFDRLDRPTKKQLENHVTQSVCTDWYKLGLELLDPEDEKKVDIIEVNNQIHGVETCCRKIFDEWLKYDNASWDQLVRAIKKIGLDHAASKIEKLFK